MFSSAVSALYMTFFPFVSFFPFSFFSFFHLALLELFTLLTVIVRIFTWHNMFCIVVLYIRLFLFLHNEGTYVALGQRPCYLSCHRKYCDVTVDWITRCSSQHVTAERESKR